MTNTGAGRRLDKTQRKFLEKLFPRGDALFSPEETLIFGTDSSRLFAPPLAVVRPGNIDQVSELFAWADAERMPLYIRARATNMVGDCVPSQPGIVVSTLKLDRIKEISAEDFVAVAEPGVVTADFQKAVEKRGLFYPPDPASLRISTLGGNVATCAGGMRAVKYGVTRDYVLGLTAVLPGGRIIRAGGRCHKNVVGLDLVRLIVGSEGSLAFIADMTLKLLPKPEQSASLLAGFGGFEQALTCAGAVFRAGILPVSLEFMAKEVLDCLASHAPVPWPAGTGAALLFKLDGSADALPLDLKRLRRVVDSSGATSVQQGLGKEEEEPLWELRRLINPASFLVAPDKLADDVTVPRGKVLPAVERIRALGRELGLPILIFGHLGDGNLHVNVMHDAKDPDQTARAMQAKMGVMEIILSLQGSLSGEHGTGLTKCPYLDRQLGREERELMQAVKKAFDPRGILNPGKAC